MEDFNDLGQILQAFMDKTGLSGASIARSTGLSTGTISLIRNNKGSKLAAETHTKIKTFIENFQSQEVFSEDELIETTDLKMAQFIFDEAILAREMGAVYGRPGMGKTRAIKHFLQRHPEAILIETVPMITGKELLKQILDKQGMKNAIGTANELFYQSVDLFKKSEQVLIIDEAENLTTNSLEAIRRLHDFSRVPVILVGTYALVQNLRGRHGELAQLSDRIMHKWEMQGLKTADRKALFGEFAELISKHVTDIRRSTSIFRKATRLSQLANESLNASHIKAAVQTAIL